MEVKVEKAYSPATFIDIILLTSGELLERELLVLYAISSVVFGRRDINNLTTPASNLKSPKKKPPSLPKRYKIHKQKSNALFPYPPPPHPHHHSPHHCRKSLRHWDGPLPIILLRQLQRRPNLYQQRRYLYYLPMQPLNLVVLPRPLRRMLRPLQPNPRQRARRIRRPMRHAL